MARRGYPSSDALASSLVALVLVTLIVVIFGMAKAVALTARMYGAHPHNRALQIVAGLCVTSLGCAVTCLALAPNSPLAIGAISLAGGGVASVLVTAWLVEQYYNDRFQVPLTRERLITDILKRPWGDTHEG